MIFEKESKKVYIVILNYNRWSDTIECLESIFKTNYPNYQIVVVDNNSPNKSMNYIKSWAEGKLEVEVGNEFLKELSYPFISKPIQYIYHTSDEIKASSDKIFRDIDINYNNINPLILIQNNSNLGFGPGNNIALQMILKRNDADFIWLLNPDRVITKDTLKNLINHAKSNENDIIGLTVKDYFFPDKILFYGGSKINKYLGTVTHITSEENINELDYISGGSLFTHVNNFKKFGLLPENYFLYWEETDWCTNLRQNGTNLNICVDAISYDKGSTSIGKGYLAEYYYTLNSLKYSSKYNPKNIKYILIANIFRIIIRLFKLKFKNVRAIFDAISTFIFKKDVKLGTN